MTHALEKVKSGRRPLEVFEMDCDFCPRYYGGPDADVDSAAALNENLVEQSEDLDTTWSTTNATIASEAVITPPSGINQNWKMTSPLASNSFILQSGISVDNAKTYYFEVYAKAGTAAGFHLYMATGATIVASVDYDWIAGVLTFSSALVGSGGVTNVGGGWYRAYITGTSADTTATVRIHNNKNAVNPGAGDYVYVTGATIYQTSAANKEYQPTLARDGTYTNITLGTGGRTIDDAIGDYAVFDSSTNYAIVRNGVGYVRVSGDASGETIDSRIIIGPETNSCGASEAFANACYNTRNTCQAPLDYEIGTKTYSFCQAREVPSSSGLRTTLISTTLAPTKLTVAQGLGPRGVTTIMLRDHPDADVVTDLYAEHRTYDPASQGTFWGKFAIRNKYYQGRTCRIKRGFIGNPFDLANDFVTRTFFLEKIAGPTVGADARVTITAKDILKLADDQRSQVPAVSNGKLLADITAVATTATLTPTGIGDSEYPSSGLVRIGSEVAVFTRVADVLTFTDRGSRGTEAAAHSASDAVQLCYEAVTERIDDALYDWLVNYANVPSGYIPTSDWEQEVNEKLAPSTLSVLLSEPTGVAKLIKELSKSFMLDSWWDERVPEIPLQVTFPYLDEPDELNDTEHLRADSITVTDAPAERRNVVIVHYDIIDPTGDLEEMRNYRRHKATADLDASSASQYGEDRIEHVYARMINSDSDAIRLAGRLVARLRDNPRTITFALDAKDSSYWVGDYVKLNSRMLQGADGAPEPTVVRIISAKEIESGAATQYTAVDEEYDGRYGRITEDSYPDYGSATDEQKRMGSWVGDSTGDSEDWYKIA